MLGMRRREFVTLLGGALAWPLAARAAVGDAGNWDDQRLFSEFLPSERLEGGSEGSRLHRRTERRDRTSDGGMPELVADLLRKRVTAIAIPGSALAARAAKERHPAGNFRPLIQSSALRTAVH